MSAAHLTAIANDRELPAESRAGALELMDSPAYDEAFIRSLTPLFADQTAVEEGQRICDLVAEIFASRLNVEPGSPRSSRLSDCDAFVGRVRKAFEKGE